MSEILGAVELFMADRGMPGTVFRSSNGPYLEIGRKKTVFTIEDHGDLLNITAARSSGQCERNFELANPSVLQDVYEFIMSKQWK